MLFFKGGILASIYPFSAALILVGFDICVQHAFLFP